MRALWALGDASVADVQGHLADRALAYTTVATLLTRLVDSELAARERAGRSHVYRAMVDERSVRRSMTRRLIDTVFGGSSSALASHLVADHATEAELAEIDALLGDDEAGR